MSHLGTLIGSVLSADVFARYLRLRGYDVVFVSGSDEHGTPIEVEAIRRGVDFKSLTDEYHSLVKDLFDRFRISFDNYTRTHNPIHIKPLRGMETVLNKMFFELEMLNILDGNWDLRSFSPLIGLL